MIMIDDKNHNGSGEVKARLNQSKEFFTGCNSYLR